MTTEVVISREIRLLKRSQGMPRPDNFELAETVINAAQDDLVLVRNRWFRISISTRLMMSKEAEMIQGIPFPPLKPGDTLADAAIGEVIAAPAESSLQTGDYVLHPFGWREFASVDPQCCTLLGKVPAHPAAILGHGWTAYAAMTRGIQIRPGDVVFVSSGAGAIGSMAGQIARKLGASRVIGSTGSSEKADWMRQTLHYDEVIIRGEGSILEQLKQCAPEGIDVFVDIVGGEQLEAALARAREGARFVLLGALSAELSHNKSTRFAPVKMDTFALIVKRVTVRGYSADDNPEAFAEWATLTAQPGWRDIVFTSTSFQGLESAPQALQNACSGQARGVVIVQI